VPFHDFAAKREADPSPFEFGAGVQSLKDHKNLLSKLRVESDTIVAHDDFNKRFIRRATFAVASPLIA
jgi:hypothetical protein